MSSILIIGESGSGKSTSLRNLNPQSTFIINVKNKPLPFRGWFKTFGKNMFASDKAPEITQKIEEINKSRPEITSIIIDDFHALMTNQFLDALGEERKGKAVFSLYDQIAKDVHETLKAARNTRKNLVVFLLAHSMLGEDGKIRCKTVGKMVDNKVSIEGDCTIVLHCVTRKGGEHVFLTHDDGVSIAKSPLEMFPSDAIGNDIAEVLKAMEAYYEGEEMPPTELEMLEQRIKECTQANLMIVAPKLAGQYKHHIDAIRQFTADRQREIAAKLQQERMNASIDMMPCIDSPASYADIRGGVTLQ